MTTWRDGSSTPRTPAELELAQAAALHASQHAPGGTDPVFNANDILLGNKPGRVVRSNAWKHGNQSATISLTSGTMQVTEVPLKAGDPINFLAFRSNSIMTGPLHWWFALYDNNANIGAAALLAQTADQGSAAWAAGATKILQLASTVTPTVDGIFRAGVMVQGGTPGQIICTFIQPGFWSGFSYANEIAAQGHVGGGALTTTAPATLAGFTAGASNNDVLVVATSNA